jgi:hypothetical protein
LHFIIGEAKSGADWDLLSPHGQAFHGDGTFDWENWHSGSWKLIKMRCWCSIWFEYDGSRRSCAERVKII